MNRVENLLDAEAEVQADIDELHEQNEEQLELRIAELLNRPEERDADLFIYMGSDPVDSVGDFFAVPVLERDPLWAASLSALTVAARYQAWLEIVGPAAFELFQENGRKIQKVARAMTRGELIKAAEQGIGKARINGEKERRRQARARKED